MKNVIERMTSETPKFFRKLRNTGLAIAAVGTALLSAPMALPALLVKIAGYLAVAGGVMTTVSQAAVTNDEP